MHLAVYILCYRHPGWCSPDDVFFCPFTLISHFSFLFFFFFLLLLFLLDVFTTGFWKDLSAVEDESLKELASRLEATVLASRAPGTTDAYRRSFARWKKFASSKSEFQHFPAKTEHVALYLQHLIDTTHSQSAVDSAIYAIQWAHTMAAFPSPTNSPIIHAIREAAKRLVGTRPVNKKEPISAGMIRKLVINSNFDNLLELRNVCIFILAYAGFFRIQEVLHIKYGDIHFNSGYVVINVDVSKTDQLRKGNEVVISVGSGEKTCPVKILRRYLTEVERYPVQSDHFVFRALSKCKSGHKLVAINRPVSYSTIREYFKVNFKDIVPDISLFSTHSLRAGGASAAANAGVPDRLFQRHGRWRSVSAKNGYVDDSLGSRLTVSKMLDI